MASAVPPDGPVSGARLATMDRFRGLTILLMFAVHYSWGVDTRAVLRHNHYYLTVGDLAFPWFQLAAGFSLRLSLLRRLQIQGARAAYGRALRRCLFLVLLGDLPPLLDGLHISRCWGPEQGTDALAAAATYIKFDGWRILAIIGITSLWVLPVISRSVRMRLAFLVFGLLLHALAMQTFYLDFMNGLPNPVDAYLGTVGVHGREGGPLGFLVWAVPQIAGSLVYDLVVGLPPVSASRQLLAWGAGLGVLGYGLSCLSTLYPVIGVPLPAPYSYPDSLPSPASPVIPPSGMQISLTDPPFVPPPPERQRIWNDWMLSRRLGTPTFMLTTTGFGLLLYALFAFLCDARSFQLGVLRTLGQNPLIAYILDGQMGGLIASFWPEGGSWPWQVSASALRFVLTYVPVCLLEWRRIYLRV
jgi:predicted acyltransferase